MRPARAATPAITLPAMTPADGFLPGAGGVGEVVI